MTDAEIIQRLVAVGYDYASAVLAVTWADWTLLRHTGLVTVKLEPPRGEG